MANNPIPPFDPNAPAHAAPRDPNRPAQFSLTPDGVREGAPANPPFIHPALQGSPEALAYELGVRARSAGRGALPKYTASTPGAGPAMPPLDAQHHEGLTMEQQAAMHGASMSHQAQAAAQYPGSIVEPLNPGARVAGAPRQPTYSDMGILNSDVLPQGAENDPQYLRGHGAHMAMYQPNLALKYGVIRNGQHIPPQALQANVGGAGRDGQIGNRPLSQTIQDLQALTNVQPPASVPRTEEEAVSSVEPARAYGDDDDEKSDSDKNIEELIKKLDDYDFDALRQKMNKDLINNDEQRKIVESRLDPLSLSDLIMRGRVSQRVVIHEGTLEYTFRSFDVGDDMAVKRLIASEVQHIGNPGRYYLDRFSLMTMCAGITHINGQPLPENIGADGTWSDEGFTTKLLWFMKRPLHLAASIGVHHSWFELRVRRLFVAEKVKNG
jgi:hypothetical protein